ncbi:MAG: Rv3235 family protein [Micromonosporaceae bacterium]
MTAALVSTDTPPSPIRLRPVPQLEPPYDDELTSSPHESVPRIGPYDVELPLDWGRPALRPRGRTASRQRTARSARRTGARPGRAGWQATSDDLPLAIKRFIDLYVEVLNERRPLNHLLAYASDPAFQAIKQGLVRRGSSWWPVGRTRRVPAQRPRSAAPQNRPMPIRVQRLRSATPQPGVAEIAAVLRRGDEVRAVALRLELDGSRWVCTTLEFVG